MNPSSWENFCAACHGILGMSIFVVVIYGFCLMSKSCKEDDLKDKQFDQQTDACRVQCNEKNYMTGFYDVNSGKCFCDTSKKALDSQ